ncbi:hypothetical protein BpHYR1_027150 [Brachionus plicatilis]|uniref:Uncharacterized protein n=1 Tax=Brachionus plicatilis TaxID=10195 RepID=A0A3M7QGI3_BRAPC|nr:hypothetical protein BpHYR1_027150 [Brachionus plicatilis]
MHPHIPEELPQPCRVGTTNLVSKTLDFLLNTSKLDSSLKTIIPQRSILQFNLSLHHCNFLILSNAVSNDFLRASEANFLLLIRLMMCVQTCLQKFVKSNYHVFYNNLKGRYFYDSNK